MFAPCASGVTVDMDIARAVCRLRVNVDPQVNLPTIVAAHVFIEQDGLCVIRVVHCIMLEPIISRSEAAQIVDREVAFKEVDLEVSVREDSTRANTGWRRWQRWCW